MGKNNKNLLFLILGAAAALLVVEARKEKPFEDLKNRVRKLIDKLKTNG